MIHDTFKVIISFFFGEGGGYTFLGILPVLFNIQSNFTYNKLWVIESLVYGFFLWQAFCDFSFWIISKEKKYMYTNESIMRRNKNQIFCPLMKNLTKNSIG